MGIEVLSIHHTYISLLEFSLSKSTSNYEQFFSDNDNISCDVTEAKHNVFLLHSFIRHFFRPGWEMQLHIDLLQT
jgi:hypothetical protein